MADIDCFMIALRDQESGGNYDAYNPGSGAAGAYQFEPSTWIDALHQAGLSQWGYQYPTAHGAPPWLQDAAANGLLNRYFLWFGSWYNVAEAWYGGPGAVGHPDWGGGPGYPTVGQYADQVMAKFAVCGGGGNAPPPPDNREDPATFAVWAQMNSAWGLVQWIYGTGIEIDTQGILNSGSW